MALVRGLLAACLLLVMAPASAALGQASPDDPTTAVDNVHAAYLDMLDLFYRPIAPSDLLASGWNALRADAQRRGVTPPPDLPSLPDDPGAAWATFAPIFQDYTSSVAASLPPSRAAADMDGAIADLAHEQHTHYLPPTIYQQFLSSVGGGQQAVGLGIRLGHRPVGLITAVAPGGPADQAGLRPGDVILRVNGTDVSNTDPSSLTAALAGSVGTTLNLSIDRGSGPQPATVTVGTYYFPPLESRVLPGGIGYLRLNEFVIPGTTLPDGTEIVADLDHALDSFDAQGVHGLVLDLRDDGGGSLETADELLGRFLPETALVVHESDQRGHSAFEIASGLMRGNQLPMALLLNGASASASEVVASALREQHRAVLVGEPTAGVVASSEILPLPGGGALQVAVASASSAEAGVNLDGTSIPVDVTVADTRSVDDIRAGRDPQVDAAVGALASAPPPPLLQTLPTGLSAGELDQDLGAALPTAAELPTNDRFTQTDRWQRMDLLHPNQLIDLDGGSADPLALQQVIRGRGYEGSVTASYGGAPGDLPSVGVEMDLYTSTDGAHAAVSTQDLPQITEPMASPVQLGDETVAYSGTWLAEGSTEVIWRRGRVVLTVMYSDVPGNDRPETLAALATLVDQHAAAALTLP